MAITAQLADGRQLEFPDGTDPAVIQRTVKSLVARKAAAKEPWEIEAAQIANATPAEVIAGYPSVRAAIGAADPIIGGVQLAANAVGLGKPVNEHIQGLQQVIDRGRTAYGSEGHDWSRTAGNVLSPVALKVAGALPTTASTIGRIGQGATIGAAAGATTPVTEDDYWNHAGANTLAGTAVGGALPAGWELAKGLGRLGRNLVQPFTNPNQAAGRLANTVAGENAPAVRQALGANTEQGVTAGQAAVPAQSAEFNALQDLAAQRRPSDYVGIQKTQDAARLAELRTVGQDPAALGAAITARAADAKVNYADAFAQSLRADPKLAQLMTNPYVKDQIPTALKVAEAEGITPKGDLTQFLHYIKIGMDKELSKVGNDALSSTQQKAVGNAKDELVAWLAKSNPKYDIARAEFATASKPINQMEIGQELEKKLVPALSDEAKQRATVFAQALRDAPQTIKRATGSPRYDNLDEILTQPQMSTVEGIKTSLARDAEAARLSHAGMSETGRKIGLAESPLPSVGMFSPDISIGRAVINQTLGKATNATMEALAKILQNPSEAARVMESAKPYERQALVDALMKYQATQAGAQQ